MSFFKSLCTTMRIFVHNINRTLASANYFGVIWTSSPVPMPCKEANDIVRMQEINNKKSVRYLAFADCHHKMLRTH